MHGPSVIVALASLGCALAAAAADIDDQVFQFTSRQCAQGSQVWVQTAFRTTVGGRTGLVTALHGVVGCNRFTAHRDEISVYLDDLRLDQVDIEHDVAFFTSTKLDADHTPPLSAAAGTPRSAMKTVGYPQAVPSQVSFPVTLHEDPRRVLSRLLPDLLLPHFQARRSPDPGREVLFVQAPLQAGLSGAPILTVPGRQVVAVANGGLRGGWSQINWAIPWADIDWRPVAGPVGSELARLRGMPATDVFASPLEGAPQPLAGGATLRGRVVYDGRPLPATVPNADVVIELVAVDTWRAVPADVRYDRASGDYVIAGIGPGKYTPFVRAETGYPFYIESGGDFFSRMSGLNADLVVAPHDQVLQRDLQVIKSIHLTQPVDNQLRRTQALGGPERLFASFYAPSAERFTWEPVPGAVRYDVTILLKQPGRDQPLDIRTFQTSQSTVQPSLAPTAPGTHYMFTVNAYGADGRIVGLFQNYFVDGTGGWFEFTVMPRP